VGLHLREANVAVPLAVQSEERSPQVLIFDRLALGVLPPVLQPLFVPALFEAVDDVRGVADDLKDPTVRPYRLQLGSQFHALIGRVGFGAAGVRTARNRPRPTTRTPTTRTLIVDACAVGVHGGGHGPPASQDSVELPRWHAPTLGAPKERTRDATVLAGRSSCRRGSPGIGMQQVAQCGGPFDGCVVTDIGHNRECYASAGELWLIDGTHRAGLPEPRCGDRRAGS